MTENLVQCLDCKRLSLKDSALGQHGFGYCPVKSKTKGHTFSVSWLRDCKHHTPATPEQVAARMRYMGEASADI